MYAGDKFGGEISVMEPPLLAKGSPDYQIWLDTMNYIEKSYKNLADKGWKPDVLRMLLPHSTKADINITANLREWRHIFTLRASPKAHPTIHSLVYALLLEFKRKIPIIFDDIEPGYDHFSDWAKDQVADIDARCGTAP
jgi:thymidylate synthase (FAD)